jgi:predicted ATPase/DNA-binding winged helix-turn-helix (wHTH) protein
VRDPPSPLPPGPPGHAAATEAPVWRFGIFELRPGRALLRAGHPVPLGARALDLLGALLQAGGAVVDKAALMQAAWPRQVVVENALHQHMRALRLALGDRASLVQTVPGRGYRFTGSVTAVPAAAADPAPAGPGAPLAVAHWPLVGRAGVMLDLEGALQPGRCVTLLGPAGVGKTRLAQAQAEARASRRELVFWCDLAGLGRGQDVDEALARACGLPGPGGEAALQRLALALRDGAALLVLDNCEHLRDACARAAQWLLERCAGLRILATSQRPLGLAAEQRLPIEPLPLPAVGEMDAGALRAAPALALLLARVQAAGGGVTADADLPQAAELCRRLDGVPLALELAATRVATLGWAATLEGLQPHFKLLVAGSATVHPRHRSLDAAMAWSCELLPPALQRHWQALSVFRGGWSLSGAAAVLGLPGADLAQAAAIVAELVERSLVRQQAAAAGPRFGMHEAQRSHANARLLHSKAAAGVVQRHAGFMLEQAEQADADWDHLPDVDWLARHGAEFDNLVAAVQAALQRSDAPLATRLVGAGQAHWRELGAGSRLQGWLDHPLLAAVPPAADASGARLQRVRALALLDESSDNARLEAAARMAIAAADGWLDATAQAQVRLCLASAAARQGDEPTQTRALAEARRLLQGRRAGRTWAWCCRASGWALQLQGDLRGALAAVSEARDAWQACGAWLDESQALIHLADLHLALGDLAAALETGARAVARFGGHRHRGARGRALANLGAAQAQAGQAALAYALLVEAVHELRGLDFSYWVFDHLAGLALERGQAAQAARWLGFADAGYARHRGGRRLHNEARVHAATLARLRTCLAPSDLAAALKAGAAAREDELLAGLRGQHRPA